MCSSHLVNHGIVYYSATVALFFHQFSVVYILLLFHLHCRYCDKHTVSCSDIVVVVVFGAGRGENQLITPFLLLSDVWESERARKGHTHSSQRNEDRVEPRRERNRLRNCINPPEKNRCRSRGIDQETPWDAPILYGKEYAAKKHMEKKSERQVDDATL